MPRLLDLTFKACPTMMRDVREMLRDALTEAGVDDAMLMQLTLVIDEACTNIMRHAYRGDRTRSIRLSIESEVVDAEERLLFTLSDDAKTIDSSQIRPRDLTQPRPGGLGINLIDTIMDHWAFDCPKCGTGNILKMSKVINGKTHE